MSPRLIHHFYIVDISVLSDFCFFCVINALVILFHDEFFYRPGVVIVENDVVCEVALGVLYPFHPVADFLALDSEVSGVDLQSGYFVRFDYLGFHFLFLLTSDRVAVVIS